MKNGLFLFHHDSKLNFNYIYSFIEKWSILMF